MMGHLKIKLLSDLCAGNGESVGFGIDNDICADDFGFPFVPGKRILGCLRETAEQLLEFGLENVEENNITDIFGDAYGKEGKLSIGNAYIPGIESMHDYISSLKNEKEKRDYLIRQTAKERIIGIYSSVRGQTKISNDGRAEKGSLRFIRVLNKFDPLNGKSLEFVCSVDTSKLDKKQIEIVEKTCRALRHIGLNRNRGLGNVKVIPDFASDLDRLNRNVKVDDQRSNQTELLKISYQVELDSPIIIQEYQETGKQIQARTMIGIFSGIYLKEHKEADAIFEDLFLNGSVKWSALTPVINDSISQPAPAILMKLKNSDGKLVNVLSDNDGNWKEKKPKSLEGYFAYADVENGKYLVTQPETQINYHNRINDKNVKENTARGLYMQESLSQGTVYGGNVIVPERLSHIVKELLATGQIRLGRSKKVQYGTATICDVAVSDYCSETFIAEEKEPVFAILRSDLVLQNNAVFRTDDPYVREQIAESSGLTNTIPEGFQDMCRYRILTGYQAKWQMQKPKVPAVMGGSVYCFVAEKGDYPSELFLGEYQQEGMGQIELIPLTEMQSLKEVEYAGIKEKKHLKDSEIMQSLENRLLLEAVLKELREYAFDYHKSIDKESRKNSDSLNVPVGRVRQMLDDAQDLEDLWRMVDDMKTSDVYSQSEGKKASVSNLLNRFYGEDRTRIDFDKLIKDKELLKEFKSNETVQAEIEKYWKEPLSTLLHIMHYGGKR